MIRKASFSLCNAYSIPPGNYKFQLISKTPAGTKWSTKHCFRKDVGVLCKLPGTSTFMVSSRRDSNLHGYACVRCINLINNKVVSFRRQSNPAGARYACIKKLDFSNLSDVCSLSLIKAKYLLSFTYYLL